MDQMCQGIMKQRSDKYFVPTNILKIHMKIHKHLKIWTKVWTMKAKWSIIHFLLFKYSQFCFDWWSFSWSDSNCKLFRMMLTFPNTVQHESEMSWGGKVYDVSRANDLTKGRKNLATSAREILDDAPGTKNPTHSWKNKESDFSKRSPVFPFQSWAHLSNQQDEP